MFYNLPLKIMASFLVTDTSARGFAPLDMAV
jgi:hypothetical protein